MFTAAYKYVAPKSSHQQEVEFPVSTDRFQRTRQMPFEQASREVQIASQGQKTEMLCVLPHEAVPLTDKSVTLALAFICLVQTAQAKER